MTNPKLDVIRHAITDVAQLGTYDGPDDDILGAQTAVTVVCGRVSGELDRVVSRDGDGQLVVIYEARIDGLSHGTGVAQIESSSADELNCLAAVAGLLAREFVTMTSIGDTALT